jgi:Flp pilus assembly pilin Flp
MTKAGFHLTGKRAGQSMVEYGLILALVVVVVVVILNLFGVSLVKVYCLIETGLKGPNGGACSMAYLLDTFDNLDNWQAIFGSLGDWDTSSGQLCTDGSGDRRLMSDVSLPDDYRVTMNSVLLNSGPGLALMFRLSPSGSNYSGYSFQVDPGYGNKFIFRRYDINGTELVTPIAAANPPAGFQWNVPHKVEVLVSGDTFTAYIDDSPVLTATDSTYSSGGVGVRAWGGTNACFDDLSVTPP